MLERFVSESKFYMSEEELRCSCFRVGINYALKNKRGCDIQLLLDLKDEVLKEYPNLSNHDMHIWHIGPNDTTRREHIKVLTIYVSIPIDDFLQLRKENKISIL